jgi:Zn-dependent protease with chaperone function
LLALAALPLAVAMLVAVLGFAPVIGGWVVDEHCHASTGCATHVPAVHTDAVYAASLVLTTLLIAGGLLWWIARRLRRSLLVASTLRFLAEPRGRQPYEAIVSGESFAYCIGLLRPRVVLSTGLIDRLSPLQLEVVLRHELAHAARRDNLRLWLAGLALLPCPRALRHPVLADLALASEQTCDLAAATVNGNALVAETLTALGAAAPPNFGRARVAFETAFTIAGRVAALREKNYLNLPIFVVAAVVALVYAASAVAATDFIHHGAELVFAAFS